MPDNAGTLRDVLQGFNTMQAQLGLTPQSPQAPRIQPMDTPAIKHPGEISQEMSIRMQQQVQASAQRIQQIRTLQPPNVMGFMPPGGLGGGVPAGQDFAKQYQQRMQQIQGGYQQPFQAQQMAQTMGMQGFQGMPSPVFMTQPSMGVFRPGMQPPPPVSVARTPPLIQTPFTPQLPQPMFQTPLQMQQRQREVESSEMFAATMGGIPTAARGATGVAGAVGGAYAGGRIGGMFGARGRGIGQVAGLVGGGLLGFGPLGRGAERGAEAATAPAIEQRAFGLQMQDVSRNFVVGGRDLAEGGRGLSQRAGVQTANQMRKAVRNEETSGFNMRDMMGITSMAGDMGMMDMAQNSEQIVSQAKNVARGLSAFMRLANEPDVRRAMQQMSQMRAMGLTVPETTAAMQNAQQFARQAGTTVASLGQSAGMPGAMTFQRMGMTAGLGMQVGMGAGAMARQAVGAGAFTPGQLAMAGGTSGVAQQLTEAAGAGLGVTFPMMAALERNREGQLTLNRERVQGLARGDYSLTEQAGMAQQNVERLGGAQVITELSTRLNELRDQMGRMLGPQGSLLYTLQQGIQMQKELGGPGTIGIGGALRALGLDPQQARTLEITAKSPQFWQGMQQQMHQQMQEARSEEGARRERLKATSTLTAQMQRGLRPVGEFFEGMGKGISETYDDVSEWFTTRATRQRAAEQGQAYVREDQDRLATTSARAERAVTEFIGTQGYQRWAEREGVEAKRQGQVREALGDMGIGVGGGPSEERQTSMALAANVVTGGITDMLGITQDSGRRMQVVQDRITAGGFGGALARAMPNLAGAIMTAAGVEEKWRDRARGIEQAGTAIARGESMASATAVRLAEEGQKTYKEYMRAYGGDEKSSFAVMKNEAVEGVLAELKDRSSWLGDKALSKDEIKQKIQGIIAKKMSPEGAARFMQQHGDTLIPQVMRSVGRRTTDEHQGSWQETKKGKGSAGFTAGKTLQEVVENLEAQEEGMEEALGFRAGFNVSEEGMQQYKDIAMTSSADEMLMLQALALQGDDSGGFFDPAGAAISAENRRKGKKMYDALIERGVDPKTVEKMERKFAALKDQPDTMKALRRSGAVLGGMTPEDQRKTMGRLKEGMLGRRGGLAVAKGAARLAEDVEALQELAETGVDKATGTFSQESVLTTMDKIAADSGQMEELRKKAPKAYAAVKRMIDAGEDERGRGAAAGTFQKELARISKRGGKTYGGAGAGGAREEGLKEQLGTIEKLAADLTGDAEKDFAKTVPLFAKAAAQMSEAAKDLKTTAEVTALNNKMRPSR